MTIRVGIVGTGGISRAHQRAYTRAGGFEIVACVTSSKVRRTKEPMSGVFPENTFSPATTKCLKWTKSIR